MTMTKPKIGDATDRMNSLVSTEIYECERFCSNCIYEFFGGSMPSCAIDMIHGTRCGFHTMGIEADNGIYNED